MSKKITRTRRLKTWSLTFDKMTMEWNTTFNAIMKSLKKPIPLLKGCVQDMTQYTAMLKYDGQTAYVSVQKTFFTLNGKRYPNTSSLIILSLVKKITPPFAMVCESVKNQHIILHILKDFSDTFDMYARILDRIIVRKDKYFTIAKSFDPFTVETIEPYMLNGVDIDGYILVPKSTPYVHSSDFAKSPVYKIKFVNTIDVYIGSECAVYYNALKKDVTDDDIYIEHSNPDIVIKLAQSIYLKTCSVDKYQGKIVECYLEDSPLAALQGGASLRDSQSSGAVNGDSPLRGSGAVNCDSPRSGASLRDSHSLGAVNGAFGDFKPTYIIPYRIRYDKTNQDANFEKVFLDFMYNKSISVQECNQMFGTKFPLSPVV